MQVQRDQAKITYLDHRGFSVETETALLIFDYYNPKPDEEGRGTVDLAEVPRGKKIYIFVSHAHSDHYNKFIYELAGVRANIQYILGVGVPKGGRSAAILKPQDEYEDGVIYVKAYGSTDEGVSFLVRVDGMNFFHAGDLNWWHWRSESTLSEINEAEEAFMHEIGLIAQDRPLIDVAFFPVDPRMGQFYEAGAEHFITVFKPTLFFPMHFGGSIHNIADFYRKVKMKRVKIMPIKHRGETFLYMKQE